MADAGDLASKEFASEAAYNNPVRSVVPTLVNSYAAVRLVRQMSFVDSASNVSNILSVPHTSDMDHLFFVNLWTSGTPIVTNQVYGSWGSPNTGLLYSNIRSGSAMASALHSQYDFYRVRCMKFLFEPIVLQPATNYPAIDVYIWWVPNHFTANNPDPNQEFDSFATFRDSIRSERITKVAHHAGQSFQIRFVPQVGERVQFFVGETQHDIPCPWTGRSFDPQLYTPLVVFRRPFSVAPANTGYSVSMSCVLEYKDANPNDEN